MCLIEQFYPKNAVKTVHCRLWSWNWLRAVSCCHCPISQNMSNGISLVRQNVKIQGVISTECILVLQDCKVRKLQVKLC